MKNLLYFDSFRHATWLELFFDLIFVVLIGATTHILSDTHNMVLEFTVLVKFVVTFLTIWWIWANHTMYANMYDDDNILTKLLTILTMFMIIILSFFVRIDFRNYYQEFSMVYSLIRMSLACLYLFSVKKHPEYGEYTFVIGSIYLVGALINFFASFLPYEFAMVLFGITLASDLIFPLLYSKFRMSVIIHREHILERSGLFAIIVMGESILSIAESFKELPFNYGSFFEALLGFTLIVLIWWYYFEGMERLALCKNFRKAYSAIYPQFMFNVGVALISGIIQYEMLNSINITEYKIFIIFSYVLIVIGKQLPYFLLDQYMGSFLKSFIVNLIILIAATLIVNSYLLLLVVYVAVFLFSAYRQRKRFKENDFCVVTYD